jgi:hypothetical protein
VRNVDFRVCDLLCESLHVPYRLVSILSFIANVNLPVFFLVLFDGERYSTKKTKKNNDLNAEHLLANARALIGGTPITEELLLQMYRDGVSFRVSEFVCVCSVFACVGRVSCACVLVLCLCFACSCIALVCVSVWFSCVFVFRLCVSLVCCVRVCWCCVFVFCVPMA